ncbi:BnaC04g43360D [Brassica napus]|uniref:(rape) hypothetical protein n=1 Tax=Brassica napus TaxID=3708 RepID=A0A078GEJ5_BRANA|nr:unnamed protein product [Brassica napus]CDY23786.1 BnaC04g43360D [Brassica napus]
MYVPELLEEIFPRMSLKAILKFKTMEIYTRVEEAYHIMNVQTKQMIMAVGERNRIPQGFQGDEEVEMVYLHFDVASRPSLSCDGLVYDKTLLSYTNILANNLRKKINPIPMYLVPDLLEEIFLQLPLKSIVKFRTVSKQWRSILESRRFEERRLMMNAQTKTKIMAGGDHRNRTLTWFKEDEEVEIVYLQCDVTSRPSLSCDGLVCIPVPGWVNVFNPSTGEFLRFSSGRDPPFPGYANYYLDSVLFDVFPGYWRMGFGRDNVSGSYKIVRMGFNHHWEIHRCEILDVNIGRWQRLSDGSIAMYLLGEGWFRKARAMETPRPEGEQKARHEDYILERTAVAFVGVNNTRSLRVIYFGFFPLITVLMSEAGASATLREVDPGRKYGIMLNNLGYEDVEYDDEDENNEVLPDQKLLALDLHAQEWRDVGLPLGALGKSFQVANLEKRLALAATYIENDHWNVKIWSAEAPEETWSVIYSIRLFPLDHPYDDPSSPLWFWTRPVAVSKKGNLFFQYSYKRLFKCYPETGEVRFIAAEICVISPFVENLVPLGRLDSKTYGLKHLDHVTLSSRISNFFRRMELKRSSILVTTAVVTLVMFRYCSRLSRS